MTAPIPSFVATPLQQVTPSKSSASSDQPISPPGKSPDSKFSPVNNSLPSTPAPTFNVSVTPGTPVTAAETHQEPAVAQATPPTSVEARANNLNESTQLDQSVVPSWKSEVVIPLALARIQRYHDGTDIKRDDCFQVVSNAGENSGLITCSSAQELNDWLEAISEAVHKATMRQAEEMYSDGFPGQPIVYMTWIEEKPTPENPDDLRQRAWQERFIVVMERQIFIFDRPPTTLADWSKCSRVHELHESLCRSHLSPRQLLDKRQFCFSIQHSGQAPIYLSLQTFDDLVRLEDKVQRATHEAVYKLQRQSYKCSTADGIRSEFVIHFNDGFKMIDQATGDVIWEYKFSQLKGSADDSKSLVTFTFQNRTTEKLEIQSFSCDQVHSLLFCVHSFLAAKLSLVDPTFLEKLSARSHQTTSSPASITPSVTNVSPSP